MTRVCTECGKKLNLRNTALSSPPSCVDCFNLKMMDQQPSEIDSQGPESVEDSLKGEIKMSDTSGSTDKLLSHESRIAIESARIVNVYGTFIQVVGIILGILCMVGGFWLDSQLYSSVYKVMGIISGLLFIAGSAIQGALFRMIANYVVARLKS